MVFYTMKHWQLLSILLWRDNSFFHYETSQLVLAITAPLILCNSFCKKNQKGTFLLGATDLKYTSINVNRGIHSKCSAFIQITLGEICLLNLL